MTTTEPAARKDARALKAERLARGITRRELDRERAVARRAAPEVRKRGRLWWVRPSRGGSTAPAYKRDREMARRRRQGPAT